MAEPAPSLPETPSDTVHVIAPDGTPGTIPISELDSLSSDWTVESDQARKERLYKEQAGVGTSLGAAAEGALSTATLGGYDVLAGALGGEKYREERELREKAAPISSMAGKALGLVAPALLTGGESLAAEGAAAAGATAARAGAATALAESGAAGGAAARGLLGLGRAVTTPARGALALGRGAESLVGRGLEGLGVGTESLAGRSLTTGAKMAASGAVEGGLFGAGQALSETALAPGGDYSHLAERVLAGAEEGSLFGAALGGGLGAVGGVGSKIVSKMADRIGEVRLDKLAADNAIKALATEKRAARELSRVGDSEAVGRRLLDDDIVRGGRSYEDMLARAQTVKAESGEAIGNTLNVLDEAGHAIQAKPLFQKIADDVIQPLMKSDNIMDRRAAKLLAAQIKPIAEDTLESGAVGFERLHKFRGGLVPQNVWGAPGAPDALKKGLIKMRGIMDDAIDAGVESGFSKIDREEMKAIALKRALAMEGDTASAAQHADQFVASMADGGAKKAYLDAKLSYRASRWAEDQIMKRAEVNDVVHRAIGLTSNIHGAATFAMGAATTGLAPGMLMGAAAAAANQYAIRHGRGIIADLAYRASKADTALLGKVKAFVRGTGDTRRAAIGEAAAVDVDHVLQKAPGETRGEAFARMADSVRAGPAAQPMVVDSAAPETGQAMRDVIAKGMAFLATKLPPAQQDPSPFYKPPPPGAEAVATFAKYVKAVKDPLSVLDSLNNGTISKEETEALQAVYPSLYDQIKETISNEVVARKEKAPIAESKAVQLGVLFGIPTIPLLEPGAYQIIQASYTVTESGGTKTTMSASGPLAGKIAKSFQTEADRLESGEMQL
jgi:hypothetical protein